MNRTPLPITFFTDRLQQNKPFSFSRWGDGEFNAIFGKHGINADGVKVDKGLGKQLTAVLRAKPTYYLGLLRIGITYHEKQIKQQYNHITWCNGDMLLQQFLERKGKPLIEQLRRKSILYVGPKHCRQLQDNFFEYKHYIEVEGSTAHKTSQTENILRTVRKHDIEVVGYSSGPASNIWINQVYTAVGNSITQIDFGSMWDGFFNIKSRSYMKNINFSQLLKDSI